MKELRERVIDQLRQHRVEGQTEDILSGDVLRALSVTDGAVSFVLELPQQDEEQISRLKTQLTEDLLRLDGVQDVKIMISAPPPEPEAAVPGQIAGVNHIVLVGSGKGGVGKSTVTYNLARGLRARGLKIGILDADLYGPSQPSLLETDGRPVSYDGTLIPIAAQGIKLMSMGLLTDPDHALIWRGPVLHETLQQMLFQVRWGPLDVLLIDLPPGTGDVPLSIVQQVTVDGAVLVSTPQELSLLDLTRAIDLFRRTETPIFGLIENMAVHHCTKCGNADRVFGPDLEAFAKAQDLPVLASLPLSAEYIHDAHSGAPDTGDGPAPKLPPAFAELSARMEMALDQQNRQD